MSNLVAGSNTLTITSVSSTDYDDFEFTNVVITLAGSTSTTTVADCLFSWAERTYPELFSPAAQSKTLSPYYYRYYSMQNSYLAISSADQNAYYLGPLSGNQILNLGPATTWYATAGCH
jgi:hypothetical protein